jgi:hypothetical protein
MNEQRYLIEVLMRGRDYVSQVAQKVAKSLDQVTEAQKRNDAAGKASEAATQRQVAALEQLREAHVREKKALDESATERRRHAAMLRDVSNGLREKAQATRASVEADRRARDEAAKRTSEMQREAAGLENLARKRLEDIGTIDRAVAKLRSQSEATLRMAETNRKLAKSYDQSIAAADKRAASMDKDASAMLKSADAADRTASQHFSASRRISSALVSVERQISRLSDASRSGDRDLGRFARSLGRVGISSDNTRSSLRGLSSEFSGFRIAVVIKYAQSLISVLTALAAQLFAVAAAAGQAAIGLGASLASGAAQALPVVGVLVAAFARLASVMKVVKLQNDQALTATQNATSAAKAQSAAAEQIRAAEQRVGDAQRNTKRAIDDLNESRREGVRTVQDLLAAELDAVQALESAREGRQRAISSGDVSGTVQANIEVDSARRGLTRARQDAAPVRAGGVASLDAVAQAQERVTDARRNEREAIQDLDRTRQQATENLGAETAAVNKLTDSLAQLSPAERTLYRRIIALQETYRRIARPITDIVTRAFTDVVDRVNQLLRDPRIARGFRNIAVQLAGAIRAATSEAGGERSIGAFQILSAEAARNIPQATRILTNFFRTVRNIVIEAIPAFRLLLDYVEGYSSRAERASRNSEGLSDFFVTGVRYAREFFELGLAVVRLFLALSGRGGAAGQGIRTINDLTDVIDGLTRKVNHNAGEIRNFFSQTHDVFFAILSVVGRLGEAIVNSFSAKSVQTFADFLNRVIIPALETVIQIMGTLVNVFHQVFSLPGVADVAQIAATVLLLARGLTIIATAFGSISRVLPGFAAALRLSPAVVPWIAAIMGVVAAVILLDKKLHFLAPTWRFIARVARAAWEGIKDGAAATVSWFSDVWTQGLLYWIRYPFVWMAKNVTFPLFGWLRTAVATTIAWIRRTFGDGGDFAVIGDLIAAPFKASWNVIKFVFEAIKTVIGGTLDLIAGRFDSFSDRMNDFWFMFLDVGRGAISSLLGIIGDLMGALGSIPKIGGPFKDAANDIKRAQQSIDDLRDSTKEQRREQKRSDEAVKDSLPTLVRLRNRYEEAKDRLDKLEPGTRRYRKAARDAKDASVDYNNALKNTADKAGSARQPVSRLRGNIARLGDVSSDTAEAVANDLNAVLKEVGAKEINVRIRRSKRRSGAQNLTDSDNPLLGNPFATRATGGYASPFGGSAADDHILMAPGGRPVAALSGTEGIVNTPQMGVINNALSFTQQMTGGGYGSLDDLWGSGMRHYATGGALRRGGIVPIPGNPGERIYAPILPSLVKLLRRYEARVTDGYATSGHTGNSDHYWGGAVDLVPRRGNWNKIDALARWAEPSQNNPRRPFRWVGYTGDANHGRGDHLHLSWMRGRYGLPDGIGGGVGQVQMPRLSGLGNNAISRVAQGSARRLTRAANRYLERQTGTMGMGGAESRKAMGADANVISAFRRAIRTTGAGAKARLALWMAGIVESGLKNLSYGDRDSLGALQLRAGLHGRGLALNPYGSALAFLRRGFWGKGGAISLAARHRGATAGWIAQQVQGSGFPHRYDQVRGRAMRYMNTGGSLRGSVGARTVVPPRQGPVRGLFNLIERGMSPALTGIASLFADVNKALEATARGPLRRSKNLTLRIQRAFSRITGDGGLLDQMREQIETITARSAAALQRRQFRVSGGGPRRIATTESDLALAELQGLQGQRSGLRDERSAINDSIEAAQRSLRVARRRGNQKAADAAQAALANLRARLETNANDLAQNAQDQVESQERFQQGLLETVNETAERQNAAVDRWSRVAKAFGFKLDPNAVLGAQINNMNAQISSLQGVLAQARRTGNTELANQVSDQIQELNVQIAEAVAQQFQNSIDAVNERAQRASAGLDRRTRIAQLGGQTDFAAMQNILQGRGRVLTDQRAGLLSLLAQAQSSGNAEQVDNLIDQIDELNVQISENTQAVQDNTNAAFNFQTQQINDAASFSQSVFGGAQSFFQALTENTGMNTATQQISALQGTGTALQAQQGGLSGQLASLIGNNTVLGLNGSELVNYLVSISSGPAFKAIMDRLDPTQETAFKDLITALLGNATALEQNTHAIDQMTQPGAQSFASTLWSTFRTAVFTGAGGLLPQYQMAIPTAATGARVLASGMLVAHAGETIRPASVSRDYRRDSGDTYQLNVTTPTEVLNPTDVARQLAFYRKSQGR